jgi:hypothetical protein
MKTLKIAAIIFAVSLSLVVRGQNSPPNVGSITGTVRDTNGSVIPGVTVTAVGPAGTLRAITNETGLYVIHNVQAGVYDVRAALPGFNDDSYRVTVTAGIPVNAGFRLSIGQFPNAPGPLRPFPSPSHPSIRADLQTRQGAIVHYRGNVVMTANGLEVRGDELDYDTINGTGDVRGNVKFRVSPSAVRVIPLSK